MKRKTTRIKGLLAGCLLLALTAQAAEREYTAAVQERLYQDKHVFGLWAGVVPDEDYTINYPLAFSYRYHFNNHLAWETIRGNYYLTQDRDLQTQLIEDYGIAPSDFDYPLYSGFSSVVFKPGYGKDSLFNRWVLNHESHLSVGGGLTGFLKEYNYGSNTEELAWSIRLAAGRKYYLNRHWAMHFELEETFAFKESGTTNNLALNMGLSFQFSFKKPLTEQNEELKLLYEYLGAENEK